MDRHARGTQHLALPTAAALAYFEITGNQVDGALASQTREVLCDVAHALSILAPIHVMEGSPAMPRELLQGQMIGATFQRGAQLLTLRDGTELRNLTIQRGDLEGAVQALKEAGFLGR
jgi:urease gamma subunit